MLKGLIFLRRHIVSLFTLACVAARDILHPVYYSRAIEASLRRKQIERLPESLVKELATIYYGMDTLRLATTDILWLGVCLGRKQLWCVLKPDDCSQNCSFVLSVLQHYARGTSMDHSSLRCSTKQAREEWYLIPRLFRVVTELVLEQEKGKLEEYKMTLSDIAAWLHRSSHDCLDSLANVYLAYPPPSLRSFLDSLEIPSPDVDSDAEDNLEGKLHAAVCSGALPLVQTLVAELYPHDDMPVSDESDYIRKAARRGHTGMLQWFLQRASAHFRKNGLYVRDLHGHPDMSEGSLWNCVYDETIADVVSSIEEPVMNEFVYLPLTILDYTLKKGLFDDALTKTRLLASVHYIPHMQRLLRAGADVTSEVVFDSICGLEHWKVQEFLNAGYDVNSVFRHWHPIHGRFCAALHVAVAVDCWYRCSPMEGSHSMVELILNAVGVDVNLFSPIDVERYGTSVPGCPLGDNATETLTCTPLGVVLMVCMSSSIDLSSTAVAMIDFLRGRGADVKAVFGWTNETLFDCVARFESRLPLAIVHHVYHLKSVV